MKRIVLISVLVFFLLVLAGNLIYLFYFVKQVEIRKMYLEVADARTIYEENVLFFGYKYPGSIEDRTSNVHIENGYTYPILVSVKITGNISDYVAVSDNDFILMPGEKIVLVYKAEIPPDIGEGIYTGETRVVFTKALK